MISDQDIEKLKQVFATKEDLNAFATKKDLNKFVTRDEWRDQNIVIVNEFKGLVQLMGEMEERLITRMDEKFDKQDERFERMEQRFKESDEKLDKLYQEMIEQNRLQDKKFYNLLEKMNDQYSILLNQEKRIAKTEHKLFPAA